MTPKNIAVGAGRAGRLKRAEAEGMTVDGSTSKQPVSRRIERGSPGEFCTVIFVPWRYESGGSPRQLRHKSRRTTAIQRARRIVTC